MSKQPEKDVIPARPIPDDFQQGGNYERALKLWLFRYGGPAGQKELADMIPKPAEWITAKPIEPGGKIRIFTKDDQTNPKTIKLPKGSQIKEIRVEHDPKPIRLIRPLVVIGIDTGVDTGLAVWNIGARSLDFVLTLPIHRAIDQVKGYAQTFGTDRILVRFEDARKRKYFGQSGREKLQGAGSVKRDGKIWEDFLKDSGIPFEAVPPKDNTTKLNPETFENLTGWKQRTSEHARDAAMLVFGIR